MVQSSAKTVSNYLAELNSDQRSVIRKVRKCIRDNLPKGYVEVMNWGMITYEIPLKRFPDTYNKKPLLYCSLAAQKHHSAVYLMTVYAGSKYLKLLETGYKKAGIKLSMGKCCVRFKKLDDIDLSTIGNVVKACLVEKFINLYNASHKSMQTK
jgi:hypothetical protein